MKKKKLTFSEKNTNAVDKTNIVVRKQEDIDKFNNLIGYRKARMKRYGKSSTQRLKERSKK